MSDPTPEKHTFQAEIRQLLDIVVHSLYTDREIFIRELISNASDSMEKLRHLQGTEKDIFDPELPLEIQITTDESARTITISDHGIGMTHDELVRNLGTIAHSGTKAFLQAIKENGGQAANMIGQFGVGFYSAFMVADRVSVFTHGYQQDAGHLVWISDGTGGYEIAEAPGQHRGCRIVIELKEEFADFANESKVRHWIETYSNFVGFPILLNGTRVNEVEALWLKNKSGITDEEYEAFYKFTAKAFDTPSYRLHFSADAPLAIHSLVFVPSENQERWGFGQIDPGVALYCRKVLIDPQPKGLLPDWMRFLKGVIDSEDLPLNISRETMQDSALVRKLGEVISKRVLRMLESEAESDPAKFQEFYRKFDRFFKEGIATDHTHRETLAKLLRFESSMSEAGKLTSFQEYLTRAKDGQKEIYYLVGSSRDQIESSPTLEAFKARGLEVIYFTDPVDNYVVDSLREFDGKKLVSVDRAGVDLEGDIPTGGESLSDEETEKLCGFLKEVLGERVTKVASGKRLVDSPIIALVPEHGLSPQMRRMMKAMNEDYQDEVNVELEINPRHPLVRKLAATRESNRELAELVARQLFDNSLIAAGLLEDARDTVTRMNQLMEKALG
jgi:molecular chaperone HtpG